VLRRNLGDDGVLTLTLDAPERRNALDYDTVGALGDALRTADADPSVRATLVTAEGPVFSAGADLQQFEEELGASATEFYRSGAVWEELFTRVPATGTPLVVAVNGAARAGAVGLVALADIAVAGHAATFALSEIKIGLFPIIVLPIMIRTVGFRTAQELALTGRTVDADEARSIGLVNRVVADDHLASEARTVAAELAQGPPTALGYGRRLLATLADMPDDAAVHHARPMRGIFLQPADLREGVRAILEKRPPDWPQADQKEA
jgi:enoyl-CoA hydratase/carnithine racemase